MGPLGGQCGAQISKKKKTAKMGDTQRAFLFFCDFCVPWGLVAPILSLLTPLDCHFVYFLDLLRVAVGDPFLHPFLDAF